VTDSFATTEQENVLAEATMIIPDTRQRLEAAYQDLQALLVSAQVHIQALHVVSRPQAC
jgi:Tubulin binding cofactor A